jgi:hypothetical protein
MLSKVCISCSAISLTAHILGQPDSVFFLTFFHSLLQGGWWIINNKIKRWPWLESLVYFISFASPCISQYLGHDPVLQLVAKTFTPFLALFISQIRVTTYQFLLLLMVTLVNLFNIEQGFKYQEVSLGSTFFSIIGVISSVYLGKLQKQNNTDSEPIYLMSLIWSLPTVLLMYRHINFHLSSVLALIIQWPCNRYISLLRKEENLIYLNLVLTARRLFETVIIMIWYNKKISVIKCLTCIINFVVIRLFRNK